jgi:hypothetical protein
MGTIWEPGGRGMSAVGSCDQRTGEETTDRPSLIRPKHVVAVTTDEEKDCCVDGIIVKLIT